MPGQVLHAQVAGQRLAAQFVDAAAARIVDDAGHQQLSEPLALERGTDDQGEVGDDIVGVGDDAHLAERAFAAVRVAFDGDQRHLALVVDLRKARQQLARQLAHGVEEAHARILGGQRGEQVAQRVLVLRTDRPQQQLAALPLDLALELLRIGADGKAPEAKVAAALLDVHCGFQGNDPAGLDIERVDVDGDHFVDFGEQLREANQGIAHRRLQRDALVGRCILGEAAARDQFLGEIEVERRQADDDASVAGMHAAPEVNHRAEHLVLGDADAQRRNDPACRAAAQPVAMHAQPRMGIAYGSTQGTHGSLDVSRRAQLGRGFAQRLAATSQQVEVDRIADGVGHLDRRLDTGCRRVFGGIDAVGLEQAAGLARSEHVRTGGQRLADHAMGNRRVGGIALGQRLRHLHQQLAVAVVIEQPGEGSHAQLGGVESELAELGDDALRFEHRVAAHPASKYVALAARTDTADFDGDLGRRRERRRRADGHHRIGAAIGEQRGDDLAPDKRPGTGRQDQRIAERGLGFEHASQAAHGVAGECHAPAAPPNERLDGKAGQAAAAGDDGQAVAGHRPDTRHRLKRLEDVTQRRDAYPAGAAQRRIIDIVAGKRRLTGRRGGEAAGADGHHRLVARRGPCRRHELAPNGYAVELDEDALGIGIVGQPVDDVGQIDVEAGSKVDDGRKTDPGARGPADDRSGDRGGLRDQRDLAGLGGDRGDTGVDAESGHQESAAARAEQAHQVRPRRFEDRLAHCGKLGFAELVAD